jgi:hypothetical protein
MSCPHDKPITKEALEEAFKILDAQPLQPSRIYMNVHDYEDISGNRHCKECNGFFPKELDTHPPDDCNLEKVRQIMES